MEEPLSLLDNLTKYSTVFHMLMFIDSFSLYSLRAQYGENTLCNAVHGSSNKEHASKTIEMIFGEVEFGPDGSVKEGMCTITITETPFMYTQPVYRLGMGNYENMSQRLLSMQVSRLLYMYVDFIQQSN